MCVCVWEGRERERERGQNVVVKIGKIKEGLVFCG